MTAARRLIFGLLFALGLARAVGYLVYAITSLPSPLETFHLEAKMVLLAYRAELGETLYPDWRDHPHVSNFFGPCYFWAVGMIGAATQADIPDLFRIGRGVSFASGILTSLVVGGVVGRKSGWVAGVVGGTLSLGAMPMVGFSIMVRPDMTAELLGISGFFLAGRRGWGELVGGGLLVLAIFTKQTTVLFLLAAALGWAAEGDWRRGLRLLVGVSAAAALVAGAGTLLVAANFARSLMGESKTPWAFASFARTLQRAATLCPDLLFFPLLGLGIWLSKRTGRREWRPAILAAVVLASSIGLAAKRGADLNYYLSLRVVEALAIGATWRAWSLSSSRAKSTGLAAATLVGCLTMGPGVLVAVAGARGALDTRAFLGSPGGRQRLADQLELCELARDPKARVLTDSGMVDLYHGRLADFADPWLFREMAGTGQLDLKVLRDRVDSGYYDLIVTTSDLERPAYASYEFGLPMPVVERARARYEKVGTRASLFLYKKRRGAVATPPR